MKTITSDNKNTRIPTNIESVWIIRALKRIGNKELADVVKYNMLNRIYPEKINKQCIPTNLNANTLSDLYLKLSDAQKEYKLMIIEDDLPIQQNKTIGEAISDIALKQCTNASLYSIQTSLYLLSLN